jgi:hypothetical protein
VPHSWARSARRLTLAGKCLERFYIKFENGSANRGIIADQLGMRQFFIHDVIQPSIVDAICRRHDADIDPLRLQAHQRSLQWFPRYFGSGCYPKRIWP